METSPVAGYWGGATAGAKSALSKRGFNQDDIFGVVFGVAVLAFLLLWFVRGRGEESPAGDLLATPQSTTGQSLAALPSPAPAPKVDPFGDAPVNLKPTGPIPEGSPADPQIAAVAPPAATPAPAAPAPVIASPPSVAANPEAAIPVAERKMHAWFCTASSRMTKSSRTALKGQMAKFDDVFAGKELVVRGYADTRGSVELNADLGSRRAQTVADYLTARGLSVVDVQGVGELNGLGDNQNCSNQRRVDVWVKGGPAETPSRECTPEPDVEALVCS
jgi:outer membrane protein OmpA-like peptidoglycan-associated protein